ncbi:MAG TPA: polysaccharide biosynthesis C-terminal domain-containing protein [Solirubrobacteraceae bacterium]|jgi:O-antigen/teichoic acid export membrane protein|nr:polysaccharide biosynthesis C-terminal domain-containing protein [Solirubrobacteraceae bacterium]
MSPDGKENGSLASRRGGSDSERLVAGDMGEEEQEVVFDMLDTPEAGGLIIRGGAMRLFGYVGTVAMSVLSTALVTRHLGPAGFSHYTTILSLVGAVAIVTDAGMSSLGTREYAVLAGTERDQLMRDLLGLRMVLTTMGVLASLAFALLAGYDTELLLATLAAGVATIGLVFQHTLSIPLMATLRLGTVSILELVRQALTVGGIVALVLVGAGVLPLLAVTLAVNLLLIPLTAVFVRGGISMRMEVDLRRWLALLRLTVSFSLATAVGAIYVYAAQILTSLVTSAHQSGLFAAPFRVFVVTITVPGLLVGGALPMLARAARDDRSRLAYALQRIFEVSLIIGLAAVLATLVGATFIVAVVAGPSFAASAPVLRILGVAMLGSFLNAGWGYALISSKRYRGLLVANGSALAVSVVLTLVLASLYGARGTAVATVCGELTLALGVFVALVRAHPEYRPRLTVVPKVAIAFAISLALPLALDLSSFEGLVLALCVYATLIALLRAIPAEILEMIPRGGR